MLPLARQVIDELRELEPTALDGLLLRVPARLVLRMGEARRDLESAVEELRRLVEEADQ